MPFTFEPSKHPVSIALRSAFTRAIGIDTADVGGDDGELGDVLAKALGVAPPQQTAARQGDFSSLANMLRELRDGQAAGSAAKRRLSALADLYDWRTDNEVDDRQLLVTSLAMAQIGTISSRDGEGMDRLDEVFDAAFEGSGYDPPSQGTCPAWCGLFAAWALKLAGYEVNPWRGGMLLSKGTRFVPVKPPLEMGDVGYIDRPAQHHFIVVRQIDGGKVFSVDGNTVPPGATGNDALGGQVAALTTRTVAGASFFRLAALT